MKIIISMLACLFLSACASNQIYYPIRVSCVDLKTSNIIEENTSTAGISVMGEWYKNSHPALDYTDINGHQVTIDLTQKRCTIAAYRD